MMKQWTKDHKILSKILLGIVGLLDKIGKMTVKFGAIGFGAITLGLSALSAAFRLGSMTAKAFNVAMSGLAAAAAAGVAALAAFAAAQRELNAATFAYTNKSAPALGAGINQSRAALRNLQADAQLASVGMEGLNAAFGAYSKNASFNASAQKSLKALDDFASAGGDRAKGLAASAEALGLINKALAEGKTGLTADIEAAGKAISPAFEKGLKEWKKKSGKKSLQDLKTAIDSGELARLAGVEGQAEAVNSTLISVLKGYFTRLQVTFGDLGQPLLKPLKEAADNIFKILRTSILRVAGDIESFAQGSVLTTLVGAFEKVADFFVKLMREYLPKSKGMLEGFGKWWQQFTYMWDVLIKKLGGAAAAGKNINKIFGGVLAHVFERLGKMIQFTQDIIAKNPEKFQTLADTISKIASGIANLYMFFAETFVNAAPAIERVVDLVFKLVDAVGMLLSGLKFLGNGFGEGFGDFAALAAMLFGGSLLKGALKGNAGGSGAARVYKGFQSGAAKTSTFIYGPGGKGSGTGAAAKAKGAASGIARGAGRFIPFGGGGAGAAGGATGRGGGRFVANGGPSMGSVFSTGYGRGRAQGQGRLSSANRGIRGAYMSKTKGGLGVGKAMGSPMAGMGLGLATQYLGSRYMDESAQSGVQVGSTMMMMGANPLLAAGAGLGVAAFNAKTAGGGALLGAGSGAAIGAMAGGPVGAVIGAAIGGVAGAIKGWWNKDKAERKKAKADAQQVVANYASDVLGGMIAGGGKAQQALDNLSKKKKLYGQFEGLNQQERKDKAASMGLTGATYDAVTQEHFGTYMKEFNTSAKDLESAAKGPLQHYNNRMGELMKMTGKSEKELHDLSMQMGVNLYDKTVNLSDAMSQLGLAVDTTAKGIIDASKDLAINALSVFDQEIQRQEAPKIIDEAAEKLRQLGTGASQTDFLEFYRTAYEQLQIMNPNASQFEIMDMFKKSLGAGGTAYSTAGNPLYGLGETAQSTGALGFIDQFLNTQMVSQKDLLANQLVSQLASSNLSVNKDTIMAGLNGMSSEQLLNVQAALTNQKFANVKGVPKRGDAAFMAEEGLKSLGFVADVQKQLMTPEEKLTENAEKLRSEIVQGVTEGFANQPAWYNTNPAWYNKESFEALIGDTHTPRGSRVGDTNTSRTLGRTMSRHNYFDSMVTGKRSVTSSYRTFGLGSINSDHVTGRAYDLTGQNLGMYQTAVNASGGFAEFHGVGGARHLHVVPGPTPIGDMTAPATMPPTAPAISGGSTSISVNVYGAAGQDEAVIAQKVVSLIERKNRNTKERM